MYGGNLVCLNLCCELYSKCCEKYEWFILFDKLHWFCGKVYPLTHDHAIKKALFSKGIFLV